MDSGGSQLLDLLTQSVNLVPQVGAGGSIPSPPTLRDCRGDCGLMAGHLTVPEGERVRISSVSQRGHSLELGTGLSRCAGSSPVIHPISATLGGILPDKARH